jgi:TonB-linked SusC/RagA family outer membrane protein
MKIFSKLSLTLLFYLLLIAKIAAQDITISGLVKGEDGNPLPGVSIVVKGTTNGTSTNLDGKYTILAPSNSTLTFSFIGFTTKDIVVNGQTSIDVTLAEEATRLEEVVVTGLATSVKRENLANAISSVSAKELMGATNPQTMEGALYGKLTGVNISANSGAPGGGFSLKLRGPATFNGSSEPLYIIDGVYIDNSSISSGVNLVTAASRAQGVSSNQDNASNRIADLNPDDIENIEVLKGPSAAAIYGARANAGVVIITTKKGKSGRTNISFSQNVGVASILNPLGVRSFNEAKIQKAIDNEFLAPSELARYQAAKSAGKLYNYEDEIYGEKGLLTKSEVTISGGSDKTTFFVSALKQDEEGIVKNTGFDRNSFRANIDHKISNVFSLSVNANYMNSLAKRGVTNNDNAGVSYGVSLTSTLPWDYLFPTNGVYPDNPHGTNFLQTRDLSIVQDKNNRFLGGASLDINVIKKEKTYLKVNLRSGVDFYNLNSKLYFPEVLQWQRSGPTATNGLYARGSSYVLNTNSQAVAVFGTTVSDINFTSQFGMTRIDLGQERGNTIVTNLIGGQANLEQGSALQVFNRSLNSTDIGYFFQQEANWKDRIVGTVGIRFDQSSMLADPNKLYAFPKASGAVNIHNFDFWSIKQVSQLKFRVAYGESGGMPPVNQVSLQQPKFTNFLPSNISGLTGLTVNNIQGDPNIKPERAKELEFGVDLGLFQNKVTLEATYYNKKTEDLIMTAQMPSSSGFVQKVTNAGEWENKGWEFSIGVTPVKNDNITWETKINHWGNRTKVTSLDVPSFTYGSFASSLGIYQVKEGESPYQIVGTVPGETGNVALGDAQADFQLSWLNNVTFLKNFQFSMLWHWKKGGDNINLTTLLSDLGQTSPDYDNDDDGDGIVNGDDRIGALNNGDARPWVQDGSFIKLREISLYYSVPKEIVSKYSKGYIQRIRVGVSGNNLLLFSDYQGYDPEVSNFGSNGMSSSVDVTPFPSSKRMFFHLNFDF